MDLAGGAAMDFAWIEPGSFAMGTLPGEEGFKSQGGHEVTITEGFWLARHEITQGQNDSQSPKGQNCLLQSINPFTALGSVPISARRGISRNNASASTASLAPFGAKSFDWVTSYGSALGR